MPIRKREISFDTSSYSDEEIELLKREIAHVSTLTTEISRIIGNIGRKLDARAGTFACWHVLDAMTGIVAAGIGVERTEAIVSEKPKHGAEAKPESTQ